MSGAPWGDRGGRRAISVANSASADLSGAVSATQDVADLGMNMVSISYFFFKEISHVFLPLLRLDKSNVKTSL